MINDGGFAELKVGHDVLLVALQEYLSRHFASGSCPVVRRIECAAVTTQDHTKLRYVLILDPPDKTQVVTERGARAYVEA